MQFIWCSSKGALMSFRAKLVDGAIVVIAFCALSVTALAARNSSLFGGLPPGGSPTSSARQVPQLASIAKEANWIGPRDAKVVITEFADFECPVCQRVKPTIDSLRMSFPDQVAIAFVHYPLSRIHPHAYRAALVAECGAQQGQFERTYDALFAAGSSLGSVSTQEWAELAGVRNTDSFHTCLHTEAGRNRVERHLSFAADLGLRGTPAFAVNNVLFIPGTPIKEVADSVEAALRSQR
ncbi:MAG: hypothetical protein C0516_10090 [Gemmatimonas sp.]|nr:hypothetical protein [Gemmatimonas sp.]